MPRMSARQVALRDLGRAINERTNAAVVRDLFCEDDSFEDELDEYYTAEYERTQSSRYVARAPTYRTRADRWRKLLYDNDFLNETEFLEHFRLRRDAFFRLVELVREDPVLRSSGTRSFRGGADLHMMVLLKCLGSSGNDNTWSKGALFMGLGAGTVGNYLRRATAVVLQLEETTITWPDEIERREIAWRMHSTYSFVNCIGMADGTLFPLEFKPTHNGEDYYSRNGVNAVNALIVCDDLARIRHLIVGWPGSAHDNRVWTNSKLSQEPSNYFRHNEYLLGDSAFQASSVMIPAFKKPAKAELDSNKTYFNRKLAKARIKTEHSIGLLKTRFQYLKRIRVLLGRKRRTMRRLIRAN